MKVGFALRSTVFHPSLIGELAVLLELMGVDSIWFPDVGGSFDAIDLCAVALASTRRVKVGTGVIRAGEQEPGRLATRARTLSESSGGRFILGIGAGRANGPMAVSSVVDIVEAFRKAYGSPPPPVFFAALRGGMLRAAASSADGAILNFCPPSHVEAIAPPKRPKTFTLACYIKLFFSEKGAGAARKMLLDEVSTYNRIPGYHKMFEAAGLAEVIERVDADGSDLPEPILDIGLANPSMDEAKELVGRFCQVGVDLPIIYPYVSGQRDYVTKVVHELTSLAS